MNVLVAFHVSNIFFYPIILLNDVCVFAGLLYRKLFCLFFFYYYYVTFKCVVSITWTKLEKGVWKSHITLFAENFRNGRSTLQNSSLGGGGLKLCKKDNYDICICTLLTRNEALGVFRYPRDKYCSMMKFLKKN